MIMASGEQAELFVTLLEEFEDRFVEIVAARDYAVHVMFLVLNGAEQDRILEIHHLRNAAAFGAEQFALRGSGTLDHLIGRAEEFAKKVGFRSEVRALGMGGEHAV